jgi:hypothetical protein
MTKQQKDNIEEMLQFFPKGYKHYNVLIRLKNREFSSELHEYNYEILLKKYETKKAEVDYIRSFTGGYFITITSVERLLFTPDGKPIYKVLPVNVFDKYTSRLFKEVNKTIFTNRFRKHDCQHLKGIGIFENKGGVAHDHYHCLISEDSSLNLPQLEDAFRKATEKINQQAHFKVFDVDKGINIQKAGTDKDLAHYLSKEGLLLSNVTIIDKFGISKLMRGFKFVRIAA